LELIKNHENIWKDPYLTKICQTTNQHSLSPVNLKSVEDKSVLCVGTSDVTLGVESVA